MVSKATVSCSVASNSMAWGMAVFRWMPGRPRQGQCGEPQAQGVSHLAIRTASTMLYVRTVVNARKGARHGQEDSGRLQRRYPLPHGKRRGAGYRFLQEGIRRRGGDAHEHAGRQ